ncbi:methyltransferase domain-containing protein [Aminobacter sp. MDW-2]|jgi:SAM-dependent methyltransferase|uniref:methyltransferase domain-containing protein n=1 Tax=Aminobacter sp. MDW-2 TaxID=2666139 RepID=UPI0012AF6646|nr:methyltransferase domain-containing protein [Aminobacter sp. MDW-2]MRX32264.1 methyltransferase domain-containing protein [Aminobacter sp. MDW-2]QNH37476.1 methyltransferase domain-containing protein [Aminobacter sp. MDW-2]
MPSKNTAGGRKAYDLCKGLGIEIGALHDPFELDATVLYLDRLSTAELHRTYNGDAREPLIKPVTLVAKTVPYTFIADGALDFVVSSHCFEHFANPGLALEDWIRILKPGGVIYAIIPNKEKTYDRPREAASVDTLISAYESRAPEAPLEQYRDFFDNKELVGSEKRLPYESILRRFNEQESIHVYAWTPESTKSFLTAMQTKLPFEFIWFDFEGINIHFGLRKIS